MIICLRSIAELHNGYHPAVLTDSSYRLLTPNFHEYEYWNTSCVPVFMLTFRSQLSSELQSGLLTVCYYQNYSHIIKCNDYQAIFFKELPTRVYILTFL